MAENTKAAHRGDGGGLRNLDLLAAINSEDKPDAPPPQHETTLAAAFRRAVERLVVYARATR
jgi:hypothetical protein